MNNQPILVPTQNDISTISRKIDNITNELHRLTMAINELQSHRLPSTPKVKTIDSDTMDELLISAGHYIRTATNRTPASQVYQDFNEYLREHNLDIVSRSTAKEVLTKAGAKFDTNSERKLVMIIPKSVKA